MQLNETLNFGVASDCRCARARAVTPHAKSIVPAELGLKPRKRRWRDHQLRVGDLEPHAEVVPQVGRVSRRLGPAVPRAPRVVHNCALLARNVAQAPRNLLVRYIRRVSVSLTDRSIRVAYLMAIEALVAKN